MCNGNSTRQSAGGTIAILKATDADESLKLRQDLSFRLIQDAKTGNTTATIDGLEIGNDESQVLIHRDGDLRSTRVTEETILHAIEVPRTLKPGASFQVSSDLQLGVGGDGIIGRRASFLIGQTVLGQGIVGWN